MATWKYSIVLGFVGATLAGGCVIKESSDDDGDAGSGAESGETSGGSSGTGGSASSGRGGSSGTGTSGSTSGSSGRGGSGTSGSAGTTSAGTGGSGTSGSTSEGGEGGVPVDPDTIPECDPDSGELDSTPYDSCAPTDAEDECQICMQQECCDLAKECYGYAPGNVCGWGGPDNGGEIVCYQECLADYVVENDNLCDADGEDECLALCTTDGCGQIGNRTQDLAACLWEGCAVECFGVTDCGGE